VFAPFQRFRRDGRARIHGNLVDEHRVQIKNRLDDHVTEGQIFEFTADGLVQGVQAGRYVDVGVVIVQRVREQRGAGQVYGLVDGVHNGFGYGGHFFYWRVRTRALSGKFVGKTTYFFFEISLRATTRVKALGRLIKILCIVTDTNISD